MEMLEHCPSIASDALLRAFTFCNARTYARYSQRTTHLALLSHLTFRAQGVGRFSAGDWESHDSNGDLAALATALELEAGEAESA